MIIVVTAVLISALCSLVLMGMIPYLDVGSFADGFEYYESLPLHCRRQCCRSACSGTLPTLAS